MNNKCSTYPCQEPVTMPEGWLKEQVEKDTGDRSYYQGKIECLDAIEAIIENQDLPAVEGYLVATILKYLWRYNLKNHDPTEDLTKASWFLSRLRERVKERAAGLA